MSVSALIISIVAVVFAGFLWWNARQTRRHHVIGELRKDYLSPQMFYAVKTVWEFHDKCEKDKSDFVEEYMKRFDEDKRRISSLDEQKRLKAEHSTLHYQRRLVSHFYQYVATLRAHGILPKDIVFGIWAEKDLRIIPKVIIPIEIRLKKEIKTSEAQLVNERELPNDLLPLYRLYADSKDY